MLLSTLSTELLSVSEIHLFKLKVIDLLIDNRIRVAAKETQVLQLDEIAYFLMVAMLFGLFL